MRLEHRANPTMTAFYGIGIISLPSHHEESIHELSHTILSDPLKTFLISYLLFIVMEFVYSVQIALKGHFNGCGSQSK
jgi:hypothetical protein